MAMERQDYPAMLPQLQPPQAVDILNDRVRQVGRLNLAIADWLLDRRRLEEQYSAGLRRLSQRPLEGVDLGVFSTPWTSLTRSADTLADSHSALATKIEVDVERPLRDFVVTNREMTSMSTIQGNLASMAKDVEKAQQKTAKIRGKGERAEAGKVATANSELDSAQTLWESQAPYVFENLQALDETRLNHLRDALTQFQTLEIDQVEKSRITAEQCLNVLLNVETADEIKTFALKAVQARPTLSGTRNQRSSVSTPSRAPQAASASNLTPTTSQPDAELTSQRSSSVQEDKQKGRLKGLKRLGTVMGRRRESKVPPGALPPTSESPERRTRPSPLNSFGRLGRSRDNTPTLAAPQEASPLERPRSPARLGSELFNPPSASREEPTTPTPAPQVNGTSSGASTAPAIAASIPNGSHQGDLADLEPPKNDPVEPPTAVESRKDSEGFSLPHQNLDPITQAQQDAAAAGEGSTPQFNVNIRDAPIQEEGGNSEVALANMAKSLQAPPMITRKAGTVRGRRQDRNSFIPSEQPTTESAREPSPAAAPSEPLPIQTSAPAVQSPSVITSAGLTQSPSGAFAPAQVASTAFSPFSPQAEQILPTTLRPDSRSATGLDHTRNDSQSIRSSTTTGSQGGIKHPDLTDTGINSSIVETVSARFERGKVTSSSLTGEIALAYNPADFSSPFGTENIRLENFSSLEKVAPNPAFINQTLGKEGEYSVNLSNIAKTQIAFKYQVRLEDTHSQAPLLVAPAFKIEPTQLSVIVAYSLNPAFELHGKENITLSNVTLALTVEGAKATTCQSRPVGTFAREKNLIFWQLNDITLTPGAAPQKMLARFATESEAKSGGVEARWEISGESAEAIGSGLSVSVQGAANDGSDPFADEDAAGAQGARWKPVKGVKKLTSGSYSAK